MLTCINIFGGPGVGKSTIAADIFASMKMSDYSVELTYEYAKSRVYEEHHSIFFDQTYIFAKQLRQLHRLDGKVDFAVCDSPLMISIVYGRERQVPYKMYEPFIKEVSDSFNNINFLLDRSVDFKSEGRVHDLEEAKGTDRLIFDVLTEYNELFYTLPVYEGTSSEILHIVSKEMVLDRNK